MALCTFLPLPHLQPLSKGGFTMHTYLLAPSLEFFYVSRSSGDRDLHSELHNLAMRNRKCGKLKSNYRGIASEKAYACVHEDNLPLRKFERGRVERGEQNTIQVTQLQPQDLPHRVMQKSTKALSLENFNMKVASSACPLCGRRHMLGLLGTFLSREPNEMAHASLQYNDPVRVLEAVHPTRLEWYEEFYAMSMDRGMKSYETQMAGYKARLFSHMDANVQKVLDLGVGTGPNIKFYARRPNIEIVGVDPNTHMEKYARAEVSTLGLRDSQFTFRRGVGESIPVADSSMDAVVCTLVLCSVKNVEATLGEVQRVLKPGGSFLFIEHVAAPEGSSLKFWQNLFDPVQQFVADGCHLTRNTLEFIQDANFSAVNAENITIANLAIFGPHIIGIARA